GPAPTASAETMAFPLSFPSSSRGRTTRSLMPWMLSSLRVETTVPTTRASCMGPPCRCRLPAGTVGRQKPAATLLFALRSRGGAARHPGGRRVVGGRDDGPGDHVADGAGGGLRGVAGGADRGHIAAHDDGGVAAAGLLVGDQLHARGLHRGVRRFH